MGVRGSSSSTAALRDKAAAYLDGMISKLEKGDTYGSRELARTAAVAKGMIGSDRADRADRLLSSFAVARIAQAYGANVTPSKLRDMLRGNKNPGLPEGQFQSLVAAANGLVSGGFAVDEIAAAINWENALRPFQKTS